MVCFVGGRHSSRVQVIATKLATDQCITRGFLRFAATVGVLIAGGCGGAREDEQKAAALEARIWALESKVAALQKAAIPEMSVLKPGANGYVVIRTQSGFPIRVAASKLTARGDGSQTTLVLRNPLAINLQACSVEVGWAEMNKDGDPIDGTVHTNTLHLQRALPAGKTFRKSIALTGIPPGKLNLLWLNAFTCR